MVIPYHVQMNGLKETFSAESTVIESSGWSSEEDGQSGPYISNTGRSIHYTPRAINQPSALPRPVQKPELRLTPDTRNQLFRSRSTPSPPKIPARKVVFQSTSPSLPQQNFQPQRKQPHVYNGMNAKGYSAVEANHTRPILNQTHWLYDHRQANPSPTTPISVSSFEQPQLLIITPQPAL